jgi:hypothetical protein
VTCQVGSSTIGRAIGEIRPLLAERGFAVPQRPGLRLRTLAGVFACAGAETSHCAPAAPKPRSVGRRPDAPDGPPSSPASASRTRSRPPPSATAKDAPCGAGRCGRARMHDQTAMRAEGIAEQFRPCPRVKAEAGEGYRGLASEFPDQVSAPPRKPKNLGEEAITEQYGWRQAKRHQSSQRIAAGHANAELRQWRPLQRWTGRRQDYAETHCAIAGLISDRADKRAARHRPSTELVPAFPQTAEPSDPHHASMPRPQSRERSLAPDLLWRRFEFVARCRPGFAARPRG